MPRAFPGLSGEPSPEQARGLIGRTWELSLDLLASREMPDARSLLHLLATFADAPIPHTLLLRHHVLAASDLFPDMTGPRIWEVLQALAAVGLIDLAEQEGDPQDVEVLRLHPLVCYTSRRAIQDNIETYLGLAATLLYEAAVTEETGQPEDPSNWPIWQALTAHAFHLLDIAHPGSEPATLTGHETDVTYCARLSARYLRARGSYGQALGRLEQVLALDRHVQGGEHPDTLATRHEVAVVMAGQGRFAEAEALYREVLDVSTRVLGGEHPDTLVTRHEVAVVMAGQGRFAEAEALYREVVAARTDVLGPQHPLTLSTKRALDDLLRRQNE